MLEFDKYLRFNRTKYDISKKNESKLNKKGLDSKN